MNSSTCKTQIRTLVNVKQTSLPRCSTGIRSGFKYSTKISSCQDLSQGISLQKRIRNGSNSVVRCSTDSKTSKLHMSESDLHQALNESAESLAKELEGTNIFLVGMMGCGKSTVGRIISDHLGYAFFDSDTMIEKAVGTSVSNIFQEEGEASFRELETQAIIQLASMESLVVATGGGAVLKDENWRYMRTGTSVWMDVPLNDLAQRVVGAGLGSRPILSQGSSFETDLFTQALNRLTSVFSNREHLYEKSDVRVSLSSMASSLEVEVANLEPKLIALQILLSLKDHLQSQKLAHKSSTVPSDAEFQPVLDVDFGLGVREADLLQESVSSQ